LRELAAAARDSHAIIDGPGALDAGAALLHAWADVNGLLAGGRLDAAIARLNEDVVLLEGWGAPTHLAVLRAGSWIATKGND
jgi:hypothetical protein